MLLNFIRRTRKSFFVLLPLALLAGYAVNNALSHYRGLPYVALPLEEYGVERGCDAGAGLQDGCHGAKTSSSTVIHIYTTSGPVYAGSTDTLRISVANPDPADVAAGFDLDVDTPAMLDTIPGMNTFLNVPFQYEAYDITHSRPQTFAPHTDSAVWSMLYTARPTAGIDTIYAAGNAVNGDSASPDITDHWDSAILYITVLPAPSIVTPSASGNVFQAYPNPASNQFFVNDGNAADVGSYTLTDAAGRVVTSGSEIPLDGKHRVDVSRIAAGAYMLHVQTRSGLSFTRSMVIQR